MFISERQRKSHDCEITMSEDPVRDAWLSVTQCYVSLGTPSYINCVPTETFTKFVTLSDRPVKTVRELRSLSQLECLILRTTRYKE